MGLPKLQDYLPPDHDPDQEPLERDPADLARWLDAALDEHKEALTSIKRSADGLRTALNRFIDDLEHRSQLTEEDIKEVVADLTSQMNRQESYLRYLVEMKAALFLLLKGPFEPDLKHRVQELLELVDRRCAAQNEMVVIFDLGIHRLLVLHDKVLVLEGEKMSSPSFWGDDES